MLDVILVFKHLHQQFRRFDRNIQTACFPEIVPVKHRISFLGADIAAQEIRTIPGTKLFFKIANQSLGKGVDFIGRVLG